MAKIRLKWILTIIIISLLFIKPKTIEVNKFDVSLKNNEILINFIINDYINGLYIQNNDINTLVILDYKNDIKNLEKALKSYDINTIDKLYTVFPTIVEIFGIKSEYYKTDNNLIMFNFYNNNFCVYIEDYQTKPDLNLCKFLYMFKFKTGILNDLIGNPEIIFQTEHNPLPVKTQELIYENWTELYTINNDEYTILKVTKENFDVLMISK
ncbi:MAG: hypothetical protein E7166_04525 [Firmicutes bacterium]|nr:hypothetical protein [Bacillota bacterium]